MTDDAITIKGFRAIWEEIHSRANSKIYTLFGRQKHLFTKENTDRGYVTKVQPRGFYDQASIWIDQQELPKKIVNWFDTVADSDISARLRMIRQRKSHVDVVIQDYFVYHDIPWTITTPTLFDHQKVKSSLGHAILGSPLYIGGNSD